MYWAKARRSSPGMLPSPPSSSSPFILPIANRLFKFEVSTQCLLFLTIILLISTLYFTALRLNHTAPPPYPTFPVFQPKVSQQAMTALLEQKLSPPISREENEIVPSEPSSSTGTASPLSRISVAEQIKERIAAEGKEERTTAADVAAVAAPTTTTTTTASSSSDEFEAPLDNVLLERNGCPFGWHSTSKSSVHCFHVSLVPMVNEEAALHCSKMGGSLARVPSLEDNAFLCKVLERSNNRNNMPNAMQIGLVRNPFADDPSFYKWRDGKKLNASLQHLLPKEREFDSLLITTASTPIVTLQCLAPTAAITTTTTIAPWTVQIDEPLPFACYTAKTEENAKQQQQTPDLDSTWNEEADGETSKWTELAEFDSNCPSVTQHLNPSLASLPEQILWKLTDYTPKSEPKRYYMVWQSKSWFGWLDFWTEYIIKYRDVRGAPIGKYVTSSRAASEHLGWSNIFSNPSVVQKYGSSSVVFSRFPIPENVLVYFPEGTLVNQVYYDPYARVPLGDKLELSLALQAYGKTLKPECDLQVTPDTYDLTQHSSCLALRDRLRAAGHVKTNWIIKGPHHGGAAITIATGAQVLKKLQECTATAMQRLHLTHEIVQRLVEDTLLLDGRKFDLRVFVLIASTKPLLVYVHRDPYFRAAIRKFSGLEKSRHVTNTHIQKTRGGNFTDKDWAEHIWTLDRVKSLANKAGVSPDFFTSQVFPKIKRSLQTVLKASSNSIVDRRAGQWKLFGVDFVIDSHLRPFLLDWNSFPGWDWSYRLPWTIDYRKRILGDAWRLTLDIQRGKAIADSRPTPKSGGYELIYHTK